MFSLENAIVQFWYPSFSSLVTKYLFFFFFFRAAPTAYGGSQTIGLIGVVASGLHYSSAGSEPCLQPTPQLTATPDP